MSGLLKSKFSFDAELIPMRKIRYGTDAPIVIRNLLVIGAVLVLTGLLLPLWNIPGIMNAIKSMAVFSGFFLCLSGVFMILYSRYGKFSQRDRILGLHQWNGDELVLDVGTGLGLLMIGVAKRLKTGKVYGMDIFKSYDLSGNTPEQLQMNIELEKVSERTVVIREDITQNSFDDDMFDVIVSNLCLHNIYQKSVRNKACQEIFRLLKPGGVAIISDFRNTTEYRKMFESLGMTTVNNGTSWFTSFPPLTIISAVKHQ